MARTLRTVLTHFSAGELDPILSSRTDTKAYFEGAKQCRNWLIMNTGGVMRRPGTEYKATLPAEARVIPFIFSEDEVAIFALSNNRLDVYSSAGAAVQSNITANCNWTTAQLFELNYAQFGDTIFLCHRNNPIRKIVRTSATSFSVSAFAFDEDDSVSAGGVNKSLQPFYKYADSAITLTPAATSGTGVTVTASANAFESDHNGTYIRIGGKQCKITGYTSATQVAVTVIETLAGTSAEADWDEQLISAVRKYPQAVTFHDNRLWLGGVKSKPASIIASQVGQYTNFNVETGAATHAIDVAIAGDKVNEVRHLYSGRNIQIFTDGGEWYVPTSSDTAAITPTNVVFRRQSLYGCNRARPSLFDGGTLFVQKNGQSVREFIYTEVEGGYRSTNLSVMSSHLIDTPKDLAQIEGTASRPENYALFVNSGSTYNGSIAVFHSIRDEEIQGWSLWQTKTGDNFHSICAANEHLFTVGKRDIGGSTQYLLEKFGEDDSTNMDCQTTTTVYQKGTPLVNGGSQSGNTLSVDGFSAAPQVQETFSIAGNATIYSITAVTATASGYDLQLDQNLAATPSDNAAITIVKGFVHTVNAIYGNTTSVNAVYGNSSLGSYTVNSSNRVTLINLPQPTGVKVGFNFSPTLETMPVDKELETGPLSGEFRRIVRCVADISSALDLRIKAPNTGTEHELVIQQVNLSVDEDLQPVTDRKEFFFLGYDRAPTVTISQNDPLPLKVLGMSLELQFK